MTLTVTLTGSRCRPEEFMVCDEPVDHLGNATAQQELTYGCVKVGDVQNANRCVQPRPPRAPEQQPSSRSGSSLVLPVVKQLAAPGVLLKAIETERRGAVLVA